MSSSSRLGALDDAHGDVLVLAVLVDGVLGGYFFEVGDGFVAGVDLLIGLLGDLLARIFVLLLSLLHFLGLLGD